MRIKSNQMHLEQKIILVLKSIVINACTDVSLRVVLGYLHCTFPYQALATVSDTVDFQNLLY